MSGQLQVRQKLSFMNRLQPLHGLQLHHHYFFNKQIDAVSTIYFHAAINNGKGLLPFDFQPRSVSSQAKQAS